MLTGKHLIAGQWVHSPLTFRSSPMHGIGGEFADGGEKEIDRACNLAAESFHTFADSPRETRQSLLNEIASSMESMQGDILAIGCNETGLLPDRLKGEFTRTVNQLRYFAKTIESDDHLGLRHDKALPDRSPIPRPDLQMIHRPVGPVGVFGASNFPLAFSVAGGDTAAALSVGCPVVVKGHQGHPGTSELVAQCVKKAVDAARLPAGIFSLVQSNSFEAGQSLVTHPAIKAVGFTGSLRGGRALYDLCAARAEPIPFYGELGSINPVFILRDSLTADWKSLASNWVDSLVFGAGQLCTNPGLVVLNSSDAATNFIQAAKEKLETSGLYDLLSEPIADAFRHGHDQIKYSSATETHISANCMRRSVSAGLFTTTTEQWIENDFLSEEVFGPLGMVAIARSDEEMLKLARSLAGQLTCSIHMSHSDQQTAGALLNIVQHKAGRVIFNGFPTGVEVCDAMVHGGPYPASTNFGATSVGSLSIKRFLRPVCFQNMPESLGVRR